MLRESRWIASTEQEASAANAVALAADAEPESSGAARGQHQGDGREGEEGREGRAGGQGVWQRAFAAKEALLRARRGIFAMPTNIRHGRAFGLHFFEPRYRWLARRCADEAQRAGEAGMFCYCTHQPRDQALAWLVRLERVEFFEDGRADVLLVPVARCRITSVEAEQVCPGLVLAHYPHSSSSPSSNICRTARFFLSPTAAVYC